MIEFATLFSGSSGNSVFVKYGRSSLLIDAGKSAKQTACALNNMGHDASLLNAILLTHEHIDHMAGVAVLARRYNIPVYASSGTLSASGLYSQNGVKCNQISPGTPFCIEDINISAFPVPHDARQPVGYRLEFLKEGKTISVATDIGYISNDVLNGIIGSDFSYIESNHDKAMLRAGSYPEYLKMRILSDHGHLSNDDCATLCTALVKNGTTGIMLGHLSFENNTPDIAYMTSSSRLSCEGVQVGEDLSLCVAPRDHPSHFICL